MYIGHGLYVAVETMAFIRAYETLISRGREKPEPGETGLHPTKG